jgi:hypothetical protein
MGELIVVLCFVWMKAKIWSLGSAQRRKRLPLQKVWHNDAPRPPRDSPPCRNSTSREYRAQNTDTAMADPSTAPPLQPAQPSRKGKKAWRKHVDISQEEHGLAQARDEQIAG